MSAGVAQVVVLPDFDAMEDALVAMNEAGIEPVLPFIDADGTANVAYGMAPSGDDWGVGYSTRNPDTATEHCCRCSHEGRPCEAGGDWVPTFPVSALIVGGAS